MFRSLKAAVIFTGALCLGACLGTTSTVSPAHADGLLTLPSPNMQLADATAQPPHDPNYRPRQTG